MDVLADVLATTGFTGVLLTQLRCHGPDWGCLVESPGTAGFHLVGEGTCWLTYRDEPPRQLMPGDVALLPQGAPHRLAGDPAHPGVPYRELERTHLLRDGILELGSGGQTARIVCGKFDVDGDAAGHPVLSKLPPVIHVPGMSADPELQGVIRLLAAECTRDRPGARAVAARLTEVLFVQVIRAWLDSDGSSGSQSWLTALRDPRIGTALSLLHADPQRPWTVEGLAREVHMSRPAFAREFKAAVGESPLAYLSRVRVDLAAELLRDTDRRISDIGAAVGYTSEFTFSRAFSRQRGLAPGKYRRGAHNRSRATASDG
ncbi:AraC family transcriptional regulator [Nocardia cyriacigeorgica]|uniref:AraC family transcriptional regulator n=2 Tax=Nocardia cyriacigeorgica TaxID=135487 RepID=UPI0018958700|nr:AraC family transcriptional regulator [Nocardia cyriacigeorgica]MBF6087343.1 AraC family transcriptional regulator [Nocardia cyriacigeorgica]MBF6092727.1 AraC family transcriptional regulator [Nocardia cyriacigeorgica]MBF6343478.1 AraC family transcriptional regulator [Nocardia cyriacigeorgica]MBF6516161.1 AraC family transcriptional regulator [Nocardia cyriacigeorgica]